MCGNFGRRDERSTLFVCPVEGQSTIMMLLPGRTVVALSFIGLLLFSGQTWSIAAEEPVAAPPSSPQWLPLSQITSEDEAIRDAAIRVLIEQGDVSLLTRLEEIRANADRRIRQAIKPLIDLLTLVREGGGG